MQDNSKPMSDTRTIQLTVEDQQRPMSFETQRFENLIQDAPMSASNEDDKDGDDPGPQMEHVGHVGRRNSAAIVSQNDVAKEQSQSAIYLDLDQQPAQNGKEHNNDIGKWLSPSNIDIQLPLQQAQPLVPQIQKKQRGVLTGPFRSKNSAIRPRVGVLQVNQMKQLSSHLEILRISPWRDIKIKHPPLFTPTMELDSRAVSRDNQSRISNSTQMLSQLPNPLNSPMQNADLTKELAKTGFPMQCLNDDDLVIKHQDNSGLELDSFRPNQDDDLSVQIDQCKEQILRLQNENLSYLNETQRSSLQKYLQMRYRDHRVLKQKPLAFEPEQAHIRRHNASEMASSAKNAKRGPPKSSTTNANGATRAYLDSAIAAVIQSNYKCSIGHKVKASQGQARSRSVAQASKGNGGVSRSCADTRRRVSICEIATDMMEQARQSMDVEKEMAVGRVAGEGQGSCSVKRQQRAYGQDMRLNLRRVAAGSQAADKLLMKHYDIQSAKSSQQPSRKRKNEEVDTVKVTSKKVSRDFEVGGMQDSFIGDDDDAVTFDRQGPFAVNPGSEPSHRFPSRFPQKLPSERITENTIVHETSPSCPMTKPGSAREVNKDRSPRDQEIKEESMEIGENDVQTFYNSNRRQNENNLKSLDIKRLIGKEQSVNTPILISPCVSHKPNENGGNERQAAKPNVPTEYPPTLCFNDLLPFRDSSIASVTMFDKNNSQREIVEETNSLEQSKQIECSSRQNSLQLPMTSKIRNIVSHTQKNPKHPYRTPVTRIVTLKRHTDASTANGTPVTRAHNPGRANKPFTVQQLNSKMAQEVLLNESVREGMKLSRQQKLRLIGQQLSQIQSPRGPRDEQEREQFLNDRQVKTATASNKHQPHQQQSYRQRYAYASADKGREPVELPRQAGPNLTGLDASRTQEDSHEMDVPFMSQELQSLRNQLALQSRKLSQAQTPINCKRFFGPRSSNPLKVDALKNNKRRSIPTAEVLEVLAPMGRRARYQSQETIKDLKEMERKLKLPTLNFRRDSMAKSICEQFMPSTRGGADLEDQQNTQRTQHGGDPQVNPTENAGDASFDNACPSSPMSYDQKAEGNTEPSKALSWEQRKIMGILQRGRKKLEKFQREKNQKEKYRLNNTQLKKKSMGVQSTMLKLPGFTPIESEHGLESSDLSKICNSALQEVQVMNHQMAQTHVRNFYEYAKLNEVHLKDESSTTRTPKIADATNQENLIHQSLEQHLNEKQMIVEESLDRSGYGSSIDPNGIRTGWTNSNSEFGPYDCVLDRFVDKLRVESQLQSNDKAKQQSSQKAPPVLNADIQATSQAKPKQPFIPSIPIDLIVPSPRSNCAYQKEMNQANELIDLKEICQILVQNDQVKKPKTILSRPIKKSVRAKLADLSESLMLQQPLTRRSNVDSSTSPRHDGGEWNSKLPQYRLPKSNILREGQREPKSPFFKKSPAESQYLNQSFRNQWNVNFGNMQPTMNCQTLVTKIDLNKLNQISGHDISFDHQRQRSHQLSMNADYEAFRTSQNYNIKVNVPDSGRSKNLIDPNGNNYRLLSQSQSKVYEQIKPEAQDLSLKDNANTSNQLLTERNETRNNNNTIISSKRNKQSSRQIAASKKREFTGQSSKSQVDPQPYDLYTNTNSKHSRRIIFDQITELTEGKRQSADMVSQDTQPQPMGSKFNQANPDASSAKISPNCEQNGPKDTKNDKVGKDGSAQNARKDAEASIEVSAWMQKKPSDNLSPTNMAVSLHDNESSANKLLQIGSHSIESSLQTKITPKNIMRITSKSNATPFKNINGDEINLCTSSYDTESEGRGGYNQQMRRTHRHSLKEPKGSLQRNTNVDYQKTFMDMSKQFLIGPKQIESYMKIPTDNIRVVVNVHQQQRQNNLRAQKQMSPNNSIKNPNIFRNSLPSNLSSYMNWNVSSNEYTGFTSYRKIKQQRERMNKTTLLHYQYQQQLLNSTKRTTDSTAGMERTATTGFGVSTPGLTQTSNSMRKKNQKRGSVVVTQRRLHTEVVSSKRK